MLDLLLLTSLFFTEVEVQGADLFDDSNSFYCQQAINNNASMHDIVDNGCTNA